MRFLVVLFVLISTQQISAQVFLQLERAESLRVNKFFSGDKLKYKTSDIDRWQEGIIMQVIPDGNSLLFGDQLLSVGDITHVDIPRPTAEVLGKSFMFFGASWLLASGVIEGLRSIDVLDTDYTFGWDTAGIGLSSLGIGFIMDRFLSRDVRRINNTNRLRILDITF